MKNVMKTIVVGMLLAAQAFGAQKTSDQKDWVKTDLFVALETDSPLPPGGTYMASSYLIQYDENSKPIYVAIPVLGRVVDGKAFGTPSYDHTPSASEISDLLKRMKSYLEKSIRHSYPEYSILQVHGDAIYFDSYLTIVDQTVKNPRDWMLYELPGNDITSLFHFSTAISQFSPSKPTALNHTIVGATGFDGVDRHTGRVFKSTNILSDNEKRSYDLYKTSLELPSFGNLEFYKTEHKKVISKVKKI